MTEREAIYFMSRMTTIGPVAFDQLLALYGSAEAAWREKIPPLSVKQQGEWREFHQPKKVERTLMEMEDLPYKGIRFLTREDEEFPPSLKILADCPIGVYVKGHLPGMKPTVAIVGARRCSEYGKTMALRFGQQMAEAGICVISGMALGIDAWGQRGALDAGGDSLAVLGSGIDVCYPASHHMLYRRLEEQGGILSEYGPGVAGLPFHFPLRNRLISALSQVILVMEAKEKSGSFITVDQALEQGKDVLALPGRIDDEMSRGCHLLIRQGAGILTGMEDIFELLHMVPGAISGVGGQASSVVMTQKERMVYDLLGSVPVHMDELIRKTNLPVSDLGMILWKLEEKKLCRQASNFSYTKNK